MFVDELEDAFVQLQGFEDFGGGVFGTELRVTERDVVVEVNIEEAVPVVE